ncbi:MAG: hypothetical protein DWQ09_09140 [Proteobacteria bacterium]|nr:MAG: hypothetical protein DWQ09_09140 [Pseudomonadota bacterium]
MDNAVALVQAYLNLNGYFTVTEYPVLEMQRGRRFRVVTDLDILAFRFPHAGRRVIGDAARATRFETDPELGCPVGQSDMIIGEVKEGRAELNRGARNPKVIAAVLARFGCCSADTVAGVVETLLRDGRAVTETGHCVRLLAFGSVNPNGVSESFESLALRHVVEYLQSYLRQHWEVLRHAQFKHPAFSFLMTLEKALRHGSAAGA